MSKLSIKWQNFKTRFLCPFWFSSGCNKIKVPYVYSSIVMSLMIFLIVQFIILTWQKYPATILGVLSGLIISLMGMYFGIMRLYNSGMEIKNNKAPIIREEVKLPENIETEVD